MHFAKLLFGHDAYLILTDVGGCAQIRIIRALFRTMANLLATGAPHQFTIAAYTTLFISLVIVVLLLGADVFAEFAAGLRLFSFATAPPDRATPLGGMRSARPVKVLFVVVFEAATLTCLRCCDLALLGLESDHFQL